LVDLIPCRDGTGAYLLAEGTFSRYATGNTAASASATLKFLDI